MPEYNDHITVRKARTLLMTRDYLFFGIMSQRFDWIFVDTELPFWGWVMLQPKHEESIDGKIYLNKRLLDKSPTSLAYVICHELLHILNRHASRKFDPTIDHNYFSAACDHTIEIFLRDNLPKLKPPDDYLIFEKAEKALGKTASVERVYEWLKDNEEITETPLYVLVGGIPVNPNEIEVNGVIDSSIEQVIKDYSEYIQIIANSVLEQCKQRETISGKMYEIIKELIKLEVPWDEILDNCIKTYVNVAGDDRTWKIPNKYFDPLGIVLPGVNQYDERVNTVIITVDSSGSISTKNLQQFSYIITENFKYVNKIIVMVHDVKIHDIREFTNAQDFKTYIETIGFKGRGGTSHEYVFKEIMKRINDNLDEISLVISLTDNYSDIRHQHAKYPFWKIVPYIILTNGAVLDNLPKEIKQIKIED